MRERSNVIEKPTPELPPASGEQLLRVMQAILFINAIRAQARRVANEANPPFVRRAVEHLVYSSN